MTAPTDPWYAADCKPTSLEFVFRVNDNGRIFRFSTSAIPSPALIQAIEDDGHAEAWLNPDGHQWRLAEMDENYMTGALAAAREAGKTLIITGIWRA